LEAIEKDIANNQESLKSTEKVIVDYQAQVEELLKASEETKVRVIWKAIFQNLWWWHKFSLKM